MLCPYCNHDDTNVLESRTLNEGVGIRRRRECGRCQKRFTTYEKVVNLDLKVLKRDGRVELFDREKLRKGVKKACWKRGVNDDQIEDLIDEVELRLLNRKTVKVPSSSIGKLVMNRLKKIDDVAYLRFASVYLDFDSAVDFKKFLEDYKLV
jgi:transcriptional repressor NrdR